MVDEAYKANTFDWQGAGASKNGVVGEVGVVGVAGVVGVLGMVGVVG